MIAATTRRNRVKLEPTAEEEAFRLEVRAFLDEHLTDELKAAAQNGLSIDRELGTLWHKKLFNKGWVAADWPVEYGGTGWTTTQLHIFGEESARAGAPFTQPFGLSMVGPVLYTFGSDEQKSQHILGILDGSVWWCQGYSEPGSGSDLASLRTMAVRDGDDYVVNGQKIWTTNAHKADWIFCLVRTDPTSKPQTGISFLLIDMKTPGIEVRPIIAIDGWHHLNEVYFTDVRVPVTNRVGEENEGWTYAKFLLGHERTGIAGVAGSKRALAKLKEIVSKEASGGGGPLAQEFNFMSRVAEVEVKLASLEMMEGRVLSDISAGSSAGDAASALKILGTEIQQSLEELRVEAAGYYRGPFANDQLDPKNNEPPIGPNYAARANRNFFYGRAHSIYGGTNEIQRNVISKAVLGL